MLNKPVQKIVYNEAGQAAVSLPRARLPSASLSSATRVISPTRSRKPAKWCAPSAF
jgi:hypothetical protein